MYSRSYCTWPSKTSQTSILIAQEKTLTKCESSLHACRDSTVVLLHVGLGSMTEHLVPLCLSLDHSLDSNCTVTPRLCIVFTLSKENQKISLSSGVNSSFRRVRYLLPESWSGTCTGRFCKKPWFSFVWEFCGKHGRWEPQSIARQRHIQQMDEIMSQNLGGIFLWPCCCSLSKLIYSRRYFI
jgi:hypothetical protein